MYYESPPLLLASLILQKINALSEIEKLQKITRKYGIYMLTKTQILFLYERVSYKSASKLNCY
jgi:hypothetical protein